MLPLQMREGAEEWIAGRRLFPDARAGDRRGGGEDLGEMGLTRWYVGYIAARAIDGTCGMRCNWVGFWGCLLLSSWTI